MRSAAVLLGLIVVVACGQRDTSGEGVTAPAESSDELGELALGPEASSRDAAEFFMAINGGTDIQGESHGIDHEGWIVVLGFVEGGRLVGQDLWADGVVHHEKDKLRIAKYLDTSSVPLRAALTKAEVFDEVRLQSSQNETGVTVYELILTNAWLSSLRTQPAGQGRMVEYLSWDYQQLEMRYTPINADGSAGETTTSTKLGRGHWR